MAKHSYMVAAQMHNNPTKRRFDADVPVGFHVVAKPKRLNRDELILATSVPSWRDK